MRRATKYLLLLLWLLAVVTAQAQNKHRHLLKKAKQEVVLDYAEVMPQSSSDISAYLVSHIRYPELPEGEHPDRVVVQFIVGKDGRIGDTKIIRSGGRELDAEVLRVVRQMPRWAPGRQNGKAVAVRFKLPITICLE